MVNATEALARLRDGNRRFVNEVRSHGSLSQTRRMAVAIEQAPYAVILGCSDSRVPAEIVFDQGLGDLFVIRVAGNIVAPSQVASVEFAVERFGTRLVVVMGHSQCGAVQATLEALKLPASHQPKNLSAIVDRIRPAVQGVMEAGASHTHDALWHHAVRANVRMSTNHLRHGSAVIEQMIQHDELRVIGAEYSLESGIVDFFDGVPPG